VLIPINLLKIGEEEVQAVIKILRSGMLTRGLEAGPEVSAFEKKFADFACAEHAVAVNTGNSTLHSEVLAVGSRKKA